MVFKEVGIVAFHLIIVAEYSNYDSLFGAICLSTMLLEADGLIECVQGAALLRVWVGGVGFYKEEKKKKKNGIVL